MSKGRVRMNLDVEQLIFRSDFHKYRKIFRALLARFLLYGHAILAVWIVSQMDSRYYAIYAVSVLLFIIETTLILYFRYGCEWKRQGYLSSLCYCILSVKKMIKTVFLIVIVYRYISNGCRLTLLCMCVCVCVCVRACVRACVCVYMWGNSK